MSWEDIKKEPEEETISLETEVLQNLIIKVFSYNEEGKELLSRLLDKFLNAPVAPYNKPASYCYYREGQNSILLGFKKTIEQAKKSK